MNTIIEAWVDVKADLALINAGQAVRTGNQFEVNNRIYGVKTESGRIYPISGNGFHPLDSEAFRALRIYLAMGESPRTETVLTRAGVSEKKREEALAIYRLHSRRDAEGESS